MRTFSERLREERKRLGKSQVEFGEIGGVLKGAQLNYEKGERNPDSEYLQRVATAGVDVTYLLTGNRTPEPVTGEFDINVVEDLVRNAGIAIEEAGVKLTPDKFAKVVAALYELEMESKQRPTKGVVLRLVRSAA